MWSQSQDGVYMLPVHGYCYCARRDGRSWVSYRQIYSVKDAKWSEPNEVKVVSSLKAAKERLSKLAEVDLVKRYDARESNVQHLTPEWLRYARQEYAAQLGGSHGLQGRASREV
jgi:hypothetical protein